MISIQCLLTFGTFSQKTVDLTAVTNADLKEARRQIYQKYVTSGEPVSPEDAEILSRMESAIKRNLGNSTVSFTKMPIAYFDKKLKSNFYFVADYIRNREKINDWIKTLRISQRADTTTITRFLQNNYEAFGVKREDLENFIKER